LDYIPYQICSLSLQNYPRMSREVRAARKHQRRIFNLRWILFCILQLWERYHWPAWEPSWWALSSDFACANNIKWGLK